MYQAKVKAIELKKEYLSTNLPVKLEQGNSFLEICQCKMFIFGNTPQEKLKNKYKYMLNYIHIIKHRNEQLRKWFLSC